MKNNLAEKLAKLAYNTNLKYGQSFDCIGLTTKEWEMLSHDEQQPFIDRLIVLSQGKFENESLHKMWREDKHKTLTDDEKNNPKFIAMDKPYSELPNEVKAKDILYGAFINMYQLLAEE